jgi:hypothetical protein
MGGECLSILENQALVNKNLMEEPQMYKVFSVCLILFLLGFFGSYANAKDENENLLPNGSFEEVFSKGAVKMVKANNGAPSAAKNWLCWLNNANNIVTEVIKDRKLALEGDYVIRMTVDGDFSGLFMYYLNGNPETVTCSGWFYVLEGTIGLGIGSNANGFEFAKSTKHNEWELIVITADGAKTPEEVLIYSQGGAVDLYADAVWINYGEKTTNPVTAVAHAVELKGKLAANWSRIKAQY